MIVYALMLDWYDFENHLNLISIYETKELAEKAKESYISKLGLSDEEELIITECLLNESFWENKND